MKFCRYCIIFSVLLLSLTTSAQKFTYLTIRDGLSQSSIKCINQDFRGFMWFGTADGLNRYDGYNFIIYRNNPVDSTTISGNDITCVYQSPYDSLLWVGTQDAGLNLYLRNLDEFYRVNPSDQKLSISPLKYIKDVVSVGLDETYVATYGKGIMKINYVDTSLVDLVVEGMQELTGLNINCFETDVNGDLWIGSQKGLFFWSRTARARMEVPEQIETGIDRMRSVTSLMFDVKGNLWIGTRSAGLVKFNVVSRKANQYMHSADKHSLPSDYVRDLLQDRYGDIWIATMDGLAKYIALDDNFRISRSLPDIDRPLNNNTVYSLFEDNSGILWIGTYLGGINKMDRIHERFFELNNFYWPDRNPRNNDVRSIAVDDNGYAWLSTSNGVVKLPGDIRMAEDPYSRIEVFEGKRSASNIHYYAPFGIIGNHDGRFVVLSGKQKGEDLDRKIFDDTGIANHIIVAALNDSDGNLWISNGAGLFVYDIRENKFRYYQPLGPDGENFPVNILAIEEDFSGRLWAGTFDGQLYSISRYNGSFEEFVPYIGYSDLLSYTKIFSIAEAGNGNIWLGSNRGLFNINTVAKTIKRYLSTDGLANDVVYSVIDDEEGILWCSTNNGISSFNQVDGVFRNFLHEEGLQSNEFNQASYTVSDDGLIYMGGINGLNIFDPSEIEINNFKPPVVISGMKINYRDASPSNFPGIIDSQITELDEITLPHRFNNFSFEFVGLSFSLPELNNYRYMLEGYDQEWVEAKTKRIAEYTNIFPGEFTFLVQASNNDGVWSDTPATLHITITPPFWKRLWFVGMAVVCMLSLIYLLFYLRLRGIRLQTIQLEEKVRIKTGDLSEKNKHIEEQNNELVNINRQLSERNEKIKEKNDQLNRQKEEIQSQRDNLVLLAKQVEESNKARIQFFTSISHEFRTPLTLISGPLNEIAENVENMGSAEIKRKLNLIINNAAKLKVLINQLLDFRKVETKNMALEPRTFDLVLFVQEIFGMFNELAKMKGIKYSFMTATPKKLVWADKDKTEKIVYNLISNAFKYTPDNGEISVSLYSSEEDDEVRITISDTGFGIDKNNLPHIFERFYRSVPSDMNKDGGSGIGLALVKKYIEMHKGKITVTSGVGEGSVFTIYLPVNSENVDSNIVGEKIQTDEILKASVGEYKFTNSDLPVRPDEIDKKTVLLIEDDRALSSYLGEILSRHYKVIICDNGEKGTAMAVRKIPDIIVCDVMLPGKDGYQLTREIRQNIKTSHIPVLMITSMAEEDAKADGIQAGADGFITKPFDLRILVLTLENLLKNRSLVKAKYLDKGLDDDFNDGLGRDDRKFLEKAVKCVEKNLSNFDFDVEMFCRQMNYSQPQTYRKIKSITNMSISEFIRTIRLRKASKMLRRGNSNIKEVAYSVGFNDPNYFTKSFIRLFGEKPSQHVRKGR